MKSQRKGAALLLVVLALLTLILLLGLSFLVSAMSFRRTSKSAMVTARGPSAHDTKRLMNSALLQIVRGTRNTQSPIHGHSLLGDLYGYDGFDGTVTAVESLAKGEFVRLRFAGTTHPNHAFDGGVVTVRDSSGAYRSGRILQFLGDTNELVAADIGTVHVGDLLIVNGYPFNAQSETETVSTEPDEAWDAVDDHNLALASLQVSASKPLIVPSFHRPASQKTLRPSYDAHPRFSATNPSFDAKTGPWDVDNDGDGIPDSIWIDVGLPAFDRGDGTRCKPLVAALIVDMDGKLNLNAHGNLAQLALRPPTAKKTRNPSPGTRLTLGYPRGYGAGPAEIDLHFLFQDKGTALEFFNSRYASSGQQAFAGIAQPGQQNFADESRRSRALPTRPFGTSYVYVDEMGHPVFSDDAMTHANPYESPQINPCSHDHRFDDRDLEWLVRHDYDSASHKSRLKKWIRPGDRQLLTTASYSIPVLPKIGRQGLVETFRDRLRAQGVAESGLETQLQAMLPPEILRGEKMDLNRPFFRGDGQNRQVIAPGGIPRHLIPDNVRFTQLDEAQYAKGLYARHLYCIAMTLLPTPSGDDISRRLQARSIAQWAVNVVDFRDPDGTHTPFEYDANPFDGWDCNGILKSNRLDRKSLESSADPNIDVVWGMERPELLMTESLALHDRMVGDFEVGGYRKPGEPGQPADDDLDQIRRPRGPLLLELHSPHKHDTGTPQPIDQNQVQSKASEGLYFRVPNASPVLNMDKIEPGAGGQLHSVWRVAISEFHGRESDKAAWSPLQATNRESKFSQFARCEPDRPASMVDSTSPVLRSERFIWMASQQPSESHPDYGQTYFNETIPGFWPLKAQLPLGRTAVISPFANFTIGHAERADPPWIFYATRQRFVFAGVFDPVIQFETETGKVSRTPALSIMATSGPIRTADGRGSSVNVSATEPLPSDYGRVYGIRSEIIRDQPCDTQTRAPLSVSPSLRETHSEDNFKTAFLQRLANCGFGWNPEPDHPLHDPRLTVNPYITVDWIPIKLSVFNSTLLPEETGDWNSVVNGDFDPDDPKFDDVGFRYDQALEFGTLEWNGRSEPIDPFAARSSPSATVGNFWGVEPRSNPHQKTARSQRPPLRLGHTIGYVADDATRSHESSKLAKPRPWLAWNNHDFTNRFELLNVPKSSPARFRLEFSTTPRDNKSHRFGHLLNLLDSDTLHELFNFVHVPTSYADSYRVHSPESETSDTVGPWSTRRSRFREPGRVNINTVSDPRIWQALGGDRFTDWEQIKKSRASKPFNHAGGALGAGSFWTRSDGANGMLAPKLAKMHSNAYRHSAMHHGGWQKLGKTVTTQSNVYAVWITMGFFELQPNYPVSNRQADLSRPWHVDALHPEGTRIGEEVAIRGSVTRHRSFYIVDRSTPVAFELGENHNVWNAVKSKRRLE